MTCNVVPMYVTMGKIQVWTCTHTSSSVPLLQNSLHTYDFYRHVTPSPLQVISILVYSLQMDLDEATEAKKHEATLAAYLKRQKIQAATSATQVAIDRQQALEGDPSLADNMESLMDKKINTLMEKQFKEYIPKHVTKVMKSWGRKNSSGGRHQPPTKPDGNTSNGHGSKKQPPAKNTANRKQNAKSTESTGKPKDTGKRKNQRKQSTSKSQPNSKQTPHSPGRNGNDSPGGKRNEGKEGNSRKRKRKQQKR